MSMWEPFTEPARRAIMLAQEVAQQFGNNYIGHEHIFVGLVRVGHGPAADTLASFGITANAVNESAQRVFGHEQEKVAQEMVFSPKAKQLIEGAFEEVRRAQHTYIGAEHLLLSYLSQFAEESELARALNIDPAAVREKLLAKLAEDPTPQPPQAPQQPSQTYSTLLDAIFSRIATFDQAGKASAVEAESKKLLYYIETEDLWKRLELAAGRRDTIGALLYAFIVAKREQRTAQETLREVLLRLEQNFQ